MSFLNFEGKNYLIFGVNNKKSVATHVGQVVREGGGTVILSVENDEKTASAKKLFPESDVYTCDVSDEKRIAGLKDEIGKKYDSIHGIVHSVAFANYPDGMKPFHETDKKDFMQALDVSCFSLVTVSNVFKDILDKKASVVTISISTTRMASENYGYMAPIKAALDSTLCFLAKSFSEFSEVRFNAVAPGLLKTSASAGIPGYVDSYLYAEKMTLRKRAVETREAANAAAFLLSDASSGITANKLVVDAGMAINYFDKDMIRTDRK